MSGTWEFQAIGTNWRIDTTKPISQAHRNIVNIMIKDYDHTYSRFHADSWLMTVSMQPGAHALPTIALPLFRWYERLRDASGGAVDPAVGAQLAHAGYDAAYSLQPKDGTPPVSAYPTWKISGDRLEIAEKTMLDIGAAGKGYLADLVSTQLTQLGYQSHTIDASGDIVRSGATSSELIGLEHPDDPTKAVGTASLQNGSLCASTTRRRAWAHDWHHVLDARSGLPTRTVLATWVVAANGMTADGLATALFFTPPERLAPLADFSWVVMTSDMRASASSNWPGELFT